LLASLLLTTASGVVVTAPRETARSALGSPTTRRLAHSTLALVVPHVANARPGAILIAAMWHGYKRREDTASPAPAGAGTTAESRPDSRWTRSDTHSTPCPRAFGTLKR
jgi:hypothetical protein